MSTYPIYAQKEVVIDSEELNFFGADADSITFNGDRVLTGGDEPLQVSIAQIYGVTSAGATAVVINSAGKLGTVVSSRKRKREIADIDRVDYEKLYALKPKKFKMIDDESNEIHYGLIAEEVDEVMKECCLYNPDGSLSTVQYQKFTGPLISLAQDHAQKIAKLEAELEALKQSLVK